MRHATEQDFDEIVMKNDKPVLVDFWAPWCAPCKALAPTLDEMAEEYAGEMEIVKVDIEANPGLAERFEVRGIPLLIIVKDGAEAARTFGTLSRSRLDAFVDTHVGAQ
ncbi:thioredoxin [Novosphingobium sp. KACC 22771]|uniref:thioredoxin n=1 Tax=Novosphingobium sp. KACC 22771 TaxID=3025670 RepID=UPI00236737D7|nr:thioredoxin [Novosphingobium sp. KACC 22771]WDF71367.1 thioredoxin [Novosphingobium sp. KACC 22771]